jgi:steroid delta-isomerase-like uncharacterized protein
MPYITRRTRLLDCALDLLIAPVALLLVGIVANWWVFLLILLCMLFCIGVDLVLLGTINWGEFSVSFSWDQVLVLLGVFGLIWFAASICAIGHFVKGRQRLVWDGRCLRLSRRFTDLLMAGKFEAAYRLGSLSLRRRMELSDFIAAHRSAWKNLGQPRRVLRKQEVDWNLLSTSGLATNFPEEVAEAARRAITVVTMAGSSAGNRTGDLFLWICAEEGEDRVESFVYRPAGEKWLKDDYGAREMVANAALERNKAVVEAFIEAINAQDWVKLDALVAAGVVRHSQIAGQPQVGSREELKAFLRREAETFPDAHESIHFLVAEGDKVAARLAFRGEQRGPMGLFPASGRALAADFMCIFRLEGGRICEVWVARDNVNALVQLGHYTAPAS